MDPESGIPTLRHFDMLREAGKTPHPYLPERRDYHFNYSPLAQFKIL
jgi:hypothetical protein